MSTRRETGLCFSGIGILLRGLPEELALRLEADWAPFVRDPGDGPFLTMEVVVDGDPLDTGEPYRPKAMQIRFDGVTASFAMPEGEARVETHGIASATCRRYADGREYYTLQNLLRAALAWCLPNRGGALLHAAGLDLDGRGFVLVGPEGSGKTSWVELAASVGARVVSDDLVLVDGIGPRPELLGSPFKSTFDGPLTPGRRPLSAILFPVHGPIPATAPVAELISQGRVVANMPFIAEALEVDRRVAAVAERLCRDVSCASLTFALDAGFVDTLRAFSSR